jgi:adenosylcobinamide-GDP ribazoletransferase
VRDALRLAFGTLTILPVRPPREVDRRTAGRAMALAPLVGLLLGLLAVGLLWALGGGSLLMLPRDGQLLFAGEAEGPLELAPGTSPVSTLLAGVLVVALLAAATRAIHLDGLADTADGLGSRKPPAQALEIMRRSDLGPFGAVTLVLTLFLQAMALERLVQSPTGLLWMLVALVLSRLTLPFLCRRGVPAARADGLGSTVAGSVGRGTLLASVGLALVAVVVAWALMALVSPGAYGGLGLDGEQLSLFPDPLIHLVGIVAVTALATGLLARRCRRRLGGVTGDVLGAGVEVALTVALLVAAI